MPATMTTSNNCSGKNRANPEDPQLLQRLFIQSLILCENGNARGTCRIQCGSGHRIGDSGADAVGKAHGNGVVCFGLAVSVRGAQCGGNDNDTCDDFNGDGQSDAEGHSIIAEGGVGDGILIETVDRWCHPDLECHLLGSRQKEPDGGTRADTAEHLGNDVQNAIKHVGFASEHGGDGYGRIELCSGNGTEDYGDGGVYDARQQGDERHVNAIHRGTKRADRINREANDEASTSSAPTRSANGLLCSSLVMGVASTAVIVFPLSYSGQVAILGKSPNDCHSTSSPYKYYPATLGERCQTHIPAPRRRTHDNEGIRLQKLLAQAGFGSRRKCEEIITEGRVEIDGELVTELGTRVDPKHQEVRVDGSRVRVNPNHVTLALNKPKRVLSAMEDPKGRYTLSDIVGDKYDRIFHMGRLDYDSEGLILMTNDGELSQHVMHPKYEVEKTYIATLEGRISGQVCRRLVTTGVQLDDGWIKLDRCAILDASRDSTLVKVVLHSGKNRIVRRIFGSIGFPVKRLVRTQIGPIKLGDLKSGSYRVLSQTEVRSLSKAVGL